MGALEVVPAPAAPSGRGANECLRLAHLARTLAWASLAWLAIEGTVGVIAGVVAGSAALLGFGLDSAIEGLASVIVVWRFTGARTLSEHAESRAQKMVAVSFFLLVPYIAVEAMRTLMVEDHPERSVVGIALTNATLLICPGLGIAKQRIGDRLGSAATKGEGKQNLLCPALAVAVLFGLLTNALFGIWWLDPAVALTIAVACISVGRQTLRGEGCGCNDCAVLSAATYCDGSQEVRLEAGESRARRRSPSGPSWPDAGWLPQSAERYSKLPERRHREVKARYWQVLDDAGSVGEAKASLLTLAGDYRAPTRSAMRTIDEHAQQLVCQLRFPLCHRKRTRSTNLLERTFVEARRRTKIIGRFPGETSALSLIWAVLELASRGWRGVPMTPKAVASIERIRRSQTLAPTPTEQTRSVK